MEQRYMSHVWVADADGSNVRQVTTEPQEMQVPVFSPDKKRISFTVSSSDALRPGSHIFIMDCYGTNRTQLTAGDGWYGYGTWSPDAKWMAYASWGIDETVDSSRIFLIEASNPGTPKLLGKGIVAWWTDAERLVIRHPRSQLRTSLYSIHRSEPLEVSEDSTMQFHLPDGSHLLVGDFRMGREGWWLTSTVAGQNAERKQILPSEMAYTAWPTFDFRHLLYRMPNQELWRISLPEGKRERLPALFDGRNPFYGQISFSRDNKQALFIKGRYDSRLVLIENVCQ
jgi:hypothetical protein